MGTPISYTDFAQSSAPINSYSQGSASGGYTVQRAGETLRSVAEQLWGDSSLWYKLAEANGLSGDMALGEGQRLNLPAGVSRSHHSASTLRPYDADEATGNVSPTTPKPKKKNKCGVFGQILLAVVAIAVTFALRVPITNMIAGSAGAAAGSAAGIAGAAAAGAAGSVVSQGIGVATGIQQKFSFKAVALAGIAAGIGSGLGGIQGLDKIGGNVIVGGVARGALGSALTQGIGVATGLQSKFSWTSVAAAGIASGVSVGLTRELKLNPLAGAGSRQSFANIAGNTLVGAASAMAQAATISAIKGTSFGDNLMRALPDAIANTIGNLVADGIAGRGSPKDDIVVNQDAIDQAMANLPSGLPSTNIDLGLSPETRIALMEGSGEISSATAAALRARATEVKTQLRDSYVAGQAVAAPALGSDGLPFLPTIDNGYAIDLGTVDAWEAGYRSAYSQGGYSVDGLNAALGSYQNNRNLIHGWDAIANGEVNKILYYGAGLPAQLAAEAVTGELVIGAAVKGYRVWQAGRAGVGGIRTAEGVVYNGVTGSGPLGADVANTFRSGSYLETVTTEPTLLYRAFGGKAGPLSKYWSRVPPSGPLQATIDSALLPQWGNTARSISTIRVPAGTTIYEGAAAGQGGLVGGGSQVVIPKVNPKWLVPGN